MEEFQEAEILWPELDQDYKEDCTRFDANSGKARTRHNTRAPLLSPPKDRVSHTWTPGFNYRGTNHHHHASWTPGFNYHGTNQLMHHDDDNDGDYGDDDGDDYNGDDDDDDDGGDYNGTGARWGSLTKDLVPPHILVSRRHSDKMACSVCVGNGRTLKGRDLRVMRDSILRLTGYLEK